MSTQPKRSFFERLTGSIRMQDDDEPVVMTPVKKPSLYANRYEQEYEDDATVATSVQIVAEQESEDEGEAQLAVDVYETNTDIIVKTMTAGVKKEDLQIHVSRETVTIKGRRDNERGYQHNYAVQELYWGPFSRTIDLPEEIDIEQASATEHHGLITIKLPKFDKKRQATLKVM
jgi:HSP20 family protein